MAKPPPAPPPSDIEGVHRDRKPIDAPANADPKQHRRLEEEERKSKGRPKPARP